ncbi:tetratricopeptide repeat protein 28-like [Stylophora pistillata]|nr:tetratricopeptide repeat protein 28-like [Stylophora pistillata]XP_022808158.1 tetratricopeptide repeat protein 28-like [Stylophora pistillata]
MESQDRSVHFVPDFDLDSSATMVVPQGQGNQECQHDSSPGDNLQNGKKLRPKDEAGKGQANENVGNTYDNSGDFCKAIEYHKRRLQIAKEVGDKAGEGQAYGNLGIVYRWLGHFHEAIQYHERHLQIAKEVRDKTGEGQAYRDLGIVYRELGHFHKAIEYHERHLKIAKEAGDKGGEGRAYGNLGNAYKSLGDLYKAIKCHERDLQIAREMKDKAGEGRAYGNLGIAYRGLGDFHKAIKYHERHLQIAKEVRDKSGKGKAYGNLGIAYHGLSDFHKAIEYHERHLQIAKKLGDKAGEGGAYANLGNVYYSLSYFHKAIEYHERHLQIVKKVGNKAEEGGAYGSLGNAYHSLGDFHKAIEFHQRGLQIAKEVGNKAGAGLAYGNLGNAYHCLGNLLKAVEYQKRQLQITKEGGDKAGEGRACGNLGNAYYRLGDIHKAIEYHECDLQIAKEIGDKAGEGGAYGNLGNAFDSLGDFHKAMENHKRCLQIAKEIEDKAGEGRAYGNLGYSYYCLGDFRKAMEYYERCLQISKEIGDKAGEGRVLGYLGNAYRSLGDFYSAIEYHECHLQIAKEVGDKFGIAVSLNNLGDVLVDQGSPLSALDCFSSSLSALNEVRAHLQFKDDWKISYRDTYNNVYISLWRLHLSQGKFIDSLCVAEDGRAQALRDLIEAKYGCEEVYSWSHSSGKLTSSYVRSIPLTTVFMAFGKGEIIFWVIRKDEEVTLRRKEISDYESEKDARTFISTLNQNALEEIGVRSGVKIENRSLGDVCDVGSRSERAPIRVSRPVSPRESLRSFYDVIIAPVADLVHGNDLILVPEGPLCLVPYAALLNRKREYLSETLRIRITPSLTTLKLLTDCPTDFHNKTGALLVGDPCVEEVRYEGRKWCQLPYAKKEVEMIGRILGTAPLVGEKATKDEVLKRLSTVALVHIAAHGKMETGEIALAPNPVRESHHPEEKDFLLTMADVLEAQLRARLVVLSCCHSARGEIKAEGVVGIARAFLGTGARSVLVSLWGIDDEATFQFMKHFYEELIKGRRVSDALHQAMKCVKESQKFREVKYWAPFVLIGDDVTLELNGTDAA